ncbi:hypothetical protein ACLB2K_056947 [Fragaria x ananassa]
MGYDGYCSEEHVGSDELESLSGSDTEEDEYGNPIRKKTLKFGGVKVKPWIRSVDINNPQFRLCLAFPNDEQCKEALREYAIRNQSLPSSPSTDVVVVIVRRRQVDRATPAGGQVEQHLLCPAYPNSPILTPLSTSLRTGGRVAEPERR